MKKLILTLGLILSLVGSVGIAEDVELKECKNEQDKISGCVAKWYGGNGKLWLETPIKNGKIEGIEREYDENGNLSSETPYKNGKIEGIVKFYYENGNLSLEAPYKSGKIEGMKKSYDENGNLEWEIPYKNDKREGVRKMYFSNGKLQATITYKDDKPISGECANGKVFTNADLYKINRNMNNINTVCEN